MIAYNDLYETLRKEKYSEQLQPLPKKFLSEFSDYLVEKNTPQKEKEDLFSDSLYQSKKQLENAIAIFKELLLRRKKKILNLVFIATETGIMKRDYENMLDIEKSVFDKMLSAFQQGDKEISSLLNNSNKNKGKKQQENKLIIFKQDTEQFVDHEGKPIGPFKSGELVNLDSQVAKILVDSDKATSVDGD